MLPESSYAVLGYAAWNQGVCYPAHHHWASEIYWQIDGTATWTTWEGCADHTFPNIDATFDPDLVATDECTIKRVTDVPSALGEPHRQAPMIPHEIDTTVTTNGPNEGALTIYFWALMPEET